MGSEKVAGGCSEFYWRNLETLDELYISAVFICLTG